MQLFEAIKWLWHVKEFSLIPSRTNHGEKYSVQTNTVPGLKIKLYIQNKKKIKEKIFSFGKSKTLVQFSSIAQSCPTLFDPMNCSTPGLPVHHQLTEFTQTHIHRVSDAIQPSHPLSSPFPPAPKPSNHQSLFQWVNSSHEVAKVLELQL